MPRYTEDDDHGIVDSFIPKPKTPLWTMDSNGRMVYTNGGDTEPTLTPGAYLAKQRGCICSRLDNDWGWGKQVWFGTGEDADWDIEYSITPNCPLHDTSQRDEAEQPNPPDRSVG